MKNPVRSRRQVFALALACSAMFSPLAAVSSTVVPSPRVRRCEQVFASVRGAYLREDKQVLIQMENLAVEGTMVRSIPFLRPNRESPNIPIQRLMTVVPSDGIGRVILYAFPDGVHDGNNNYARPTMKWFSLKRPEFAARYGIGVADELLLLPNSERLNYFFGPQRTERARVAGLKDPEMAFEDLSIFARQAYTGRYFFDRFAKGFISLASRGVYEKHDRTQEHLLGALFVPIQTLWVLKDYVRFIAAVENLEMVRGSKVLRRSISSEVNALAGYWDLLTARIGDAVNFQTGSQLSTSYMAYENDRTVDIVEQVHKVFSSDHVRLEKLTAAIDSSIELSVAQKTELKTQISELRQIYLRPAISRGATQQLLNREFLRAQTEK